jgi:CDP-diacylglycerol--serine O-phosphatidyltransferase
MAIFAASLPLIIFTNALGLSTLLLNKWLLYSFVGVFAWLMVSEIPMFALKSKSYGWKGNEWQIVFLILCLLLVLLFKYAGIAACILLYVITNILRNNLRKPEVTNPKL